MPAVLLPHAASLTPLVFPSEAPIFFRSNKELTPSPVAAATMSLMLASLNRKPLSCPGVSDHDIGRFQAINRLLNGWSPNNFGPIGIEGDGQPQPNPRSPRATAVFFTGGVDSFHTLLEHADSISALILVHGFDIKLEDTRLRDEASRMVQEVGRELGKEVVEVETNLRQWSEPLLNWGWCHGFALATVGHLLSAHFDHFMISSSNDHKTVVPWGSHPELDPLWGNQCVRFTHEFLDVTRAEKTRAIVRFETVRRHLRVCFLNRGGAYNCGRCEKCLRTMIALYALGVLEQCRTFPPKINRWDVKRASVPAANARTLMQESADLLRALPPTPENIALLRDVDGMIAGRYTKGYWGKARRLLWRLRTGKIFAPVRAALSGK